ncbi:cyclic nucleotide-binding domain-containing protein [Pleomorphovibrio marinus]|uniref:cyclic nucleotide-binding domain-containing protein n=1 Tax=Pleomorphovibrio marinus TaxID=2164132 RepID=UPI000E0B0F62|nr:cyclic nucleotide-binding domain-containing protein [Pleomorphovibrio marinus]
MKSTILIFEDNRDRLKHLTDVLKLDGYDVIPVGNWSEWISLNSKIRPDLIICNLFIPDMDGFGIFHLLSRNSSTADIPFIFLSEEFDIATFRKVMGIGADDFFSIPFEDLELLQAVEVRLKKNKKIKSQFGEFQTGEKDFFDKGSLLNAFQKYSDSHSRKYLKKKELLFMEGSHPFELYYIIKGGLKTYRLTQDGKQLITGLHYSRQFVGYQPILNRTPYQESAQAMSSTEVYVIPKEDFEHMVFNNRQVSSHFIKLISSDLFDTEKRLIELAYLSIRQRLAITLVHLYNQQKVGEKPVPAILISRKDLSNILGTAHESLNRIIADFKNEGLIEIIDGGFRIEKLDKLQELHH